MTPSTELDLDALEALARAATPGEWKAWPGNGDFDLAARFESESKVLVVSPDDCQEHPIADCSCNHSCRMDDEQQANAAFIAAANPNTVLALIELARRAQPLEGAGDAGEVPSHASKGFPCLCCRGDAARPGQGSGQQEPVAIYQVYSPGSGGWGDTSKIHFDAAEPNRRRVVYAAPVSAPGTQQGDDLKAALVEFASTQRKLIDANAEIAALLLAREGGGQPVASIGDDRIFLDLLDADRDWKSPETLNALIAHIDAAKIAATAEDAGPAAKECAGAVLTDARIRQMQEVAPTILAFARAIEREVLARHHKESQ